MHKSGVVLLRTQLHQRKHETPLCGLQEKEIDGKVP